MGVQREFCWEPWEVKGVSALEDYLANNSRNVDFLLNIRNRGEIMGRQAFYEFPDADVCLYVYNDGRGKIAVIGERNVNKKLNELKAVLGFKKLEVV